MDGAEKVLVWLCVTIAITIVGCCMVDTYEKSDMASKGYEQAFEPISKHKYWVKVP